MFMHLLQTKSVLGVFERSRAPNGVARRALVEGGGVFLILRVFSVKVKGHSRNGALRNEVYFSVLLFTAVWGFHSAHNCSMDFLSCRSQSHNVNEKSMLLLP